MNQGSRLLFNYRLLFVGLIISILLLPNVSDALSPILNGDLIFQCKEELCEEGFVIEIYPHIKYFVEVDPTELDASMTTLAEAQPAFDKDDGVYKIIDWLSGPNCRPEYVDYCEVIQVELLDEPYELLSSEAKKEVELLYQRTQLRYGSATIFGVLAFVIFPVFLVIKRKGILYFASLFVVLLGVLLAYPPYWLLDSENIFWLHIWANVSCFFPLVIFACIVQTLYRRWQIK